MANFPKAPQNTPVFVKSSLGGTYMHRAWVQFFQSVGEYFGDFQPKVDNPGVNNFASLDSSGNVQDSGFDSDSFAARQHTHQDDGQGGKIDHGLGLSGLDGDDHTQYLLLAGRGGQRVVDNLSVSGFSNIASGVRVGMDSGLTRDITLAANSVIRVNGGIVVEIT